VKLIIAGSRHFDSRTITYDYFCQTVEASLRYFERAMGKVVISEIVSGCNGHVCEPGRKYGEHLCTRKGRVVGVDKMGEIWAVRNLIMVKPFRPDWWRFGKAAGPKRNTPMAAYGDAALCIYDGTSRGTRDLLDKVLALGKPVFIRTIRNGLAHDDFIKNWLAVDGLLI
jgi:hypothetical protein